MPNLLKQLELTELSLVDRPANQEAMVTLFKRDQETETTEDVDKMSDEMKAMLKEYMDKGYSQDEAMKMIHDRMKKAEAENETLKKSLIEAGFTITKEGIEKKAAPETIEVEGETLIKADIPAVLLKKLEADAEALEAAAVEKADAELTKRAGEELPNFAVAEAKELVKAFGENEEVMKSLKAADAVFADAQKEVGKAAPADVDTQDHFNTLVKAYMNDKGVNEAAAYRAVSKTDEGRVLLNEIMKKG